MATFDVYNTEGKKIGTIERPVLFETPIDVKLIQRYVTWVRSMLRPTLAHTKTRGDVSGGGKKPWRQKGTGRARVGSSRSPIWRKGGIVFGPNKDQNWATRMPRGERRKAFFSTLADKAEHGQILILDDWNMETPKTKEVLATLTKLPIPAESRVLHVSASLNPTVFASTRNLKNIDSCTVQNLNVLDVLNHDVVLMTKESITRLDDHFTA